MPRDNVNKRIQKTFTLSSRVVNLLDATSDETGISRSRLAEYALRHLFATREGNEWLALHRREPST